MYGLIHYMESLLYYYFWSMIRSISNEYSPQILEWLLPTSVIVSNGNVPSFFVLLTALNFSKQYTFITLETLILNVINRVLETSKNGIALQIIKVSMDKETLGFDIWEDWHMHRMRWILHKQTRIISGEGRASLLDHGIVIKIRKSHWSFEVD